MEKTLSKFEENVAIIPFHDCWEWVGSKLPGGYGYMGQKLVHRFSYERFKGPIPEGMVIDHLCRNRGCVRPEHLEAVSQKENVLRGIGLCAVNAKRTHCKSGHEFSGENLWITKDGKRRCRTCRKGWNKVHLKAFYERRRVQK